MSERPLSRPRGSAAKARGPRAGPTSAARHIRRRRLAALLLAAAPLAFLFAAIAKGGVVQRGDLRVSVDGELSPRLLPRLGAAPVAIAVGGHIATTDGSAPPQLRRLTIAINRHGRLDSRGLPVCHLAEIQPASTADALRACHRSRIGQGSFSADVAIPTQAPFPSTGRVIAFNGRRHGRPVILAHVYGVKPIPTSFTLPFQIDPSKGTFATTLVASLPQTTGEWGFVTGIEMNLKRRFTYRGRSHDYLSSACPAPKGFPGAVFPLVKVSFQFAGAPSLSSTLNRRCRVRG